MNELMIYQVFPLRALTDGQPSHGILEMIDWIPHIKKLGMNAVYFSPVFSSSDHGYDTKDYQKIDERLGTNEDFKKMCDAMHEEGIQVILDGVFNHVGREFFAFEDVREKKWDSPYKDWFYINFYVDEYQAIGLVYPFEGKDYVVTAAAYDGYGYANRDALRNMLILLFIGGLSVLVVVGYILSRSTLKPIRNIVKEAEKITASHIDKRLPVKNEQDELGELSTTFNALLERLEKSFNSQKMFVSNVSHELRTPMAALTAELDLALLKERSSEQYQMAIGNALQDSHRIVNLIDGLLNLAKADYQSEQITMDEVRLDELLLDARELVLKAHPDYHIELVFEQEAEEDNVLTVIGNSYLLTTAFVNLIENNCKYSSNRTSSVLIAYWEQWAIIRLSDTGVGMSDTDKENLFTLFYRGENKNIAPGNGIGMALTQKIIHLHKGELTVSSHKDEGTTFVVKLPHI